LGKSACEREGGTKPSGKRGKREGGPVVGGAEGASLGVGVAAVDARLDLAGGSQGGGMISDKRKGFVTAGESNSSNSFNCFGASSPAKRWESENRCKPVYKDKVGTNVGMSSLAVVDPQLDGVAATKEMRLLGERAWAALGVHSLNLGSRRSSMSAKMLSSSSSVIFVPALSLKCFGSVQRLLPPHDQGDPGDPGDPGVQ